MDIHIKAQVKGQDRAEYLKGESWKCAKSPTGAHHWLIGTKTVCKHCRKQAQKAQPETETKTDPGE